MAHSSHTDKGLVSPSTVENDPNPLIIQMLEKIDPLKDSLHINSSQTQANADIIAQEIDLWSTKFPNITEQISELNVNENHRFEQVKRRVGDTFSTLSSMNDKVNIVQYNTVRQ